MKSSDIRCNGDGTLMGSAPDDTVSEFWQQWLEVQDQLYHCCLKLMNFNPTDAEDALSQAMLKAWEKVQKYAGKIDNLKGWLMQLTRNLCIDIIRQRSKGAAGVESLEWVGATDNVGIGSVVDTPEKALEKAEKATVIEQAIASLPERLHDTFILHFYHQRSHTEIAEGQGITYDNVCKRISLARKLLKEKLSGYFQGTEEDVRATVGLRMSSTKPEKPESAESSVAPREVAATTFGETESAEKERVEVVEAEKPEDVQSSVDARVSGENPRSPFAPVVLSSSLQEVTGMAKGKAMAQPSLWKIVVSLSSKIAPLPEWLRHTFISYFPHDKEKKNQIRLGKNLLKEEYKEKFPLPRIRKRPNENQKNPQGHPWYCPITKSRIES
ncbi:MAG: sigma-70 family RNA polymerase sigma factor [Symploca sp. SIO2C1]|nr:sigma-70 family RNA polymerase sigma factor [Symploca sp. SIO2C1]